MPYTVQKCGKMWCKKKKGSGKVVSRHKTKKKAKASIRAYYANR